MANSTPTITATHVTPGIVLDFAGFTGITPEAAAITIGEAEVISVEGAVGEYIGLWVSPEDGSAAEARVLVYPWQSFEIAG